MRWYDIPNKPGYQVTKNGRMRSVDRYNGRSHWIKGKELVKIKKIIARCMLCTFDRLPQKGEFALHWDDNRANNVLSNLRWGTTKDNANDAVRNGIISKGSPLKKRHSKILKRLHAEGRYLQQPAKMRKVRWSKERYEKFMLTVETKMAGSDRASNKHP